MGAGQSASASTHVLLTMCVCIVCSEAPQHPPLDKLVLTRFRFFFLLLLLLCSSGKAFECSL